jgi:hypothetical protein
LAEITILAGKITLRPDSKSPLLISKQIDKTSQLPMEYISSDRGTVKVLKGSDKKNLVDFHTKAGINFSLISIDRDLGIQMKEQL